MLEAAKECEQAFLQTQIGLTCPVLFEQTENGYWCGYTPNYTQVKVKSDCSLQGEVKNIKITQAKEDFCIGEIEE